MSKTWITDDKNNRCSVEYFGSEEAAKAALASLKDCSDCSDCSGCSGCARCIRPGCGTRGEMMAKLSQAAIQLLEDAGCCAIADDYIVIGNIDVLVMLSHRAVADLNKQAREREVAAQEGVKP